MSKVYVLDASAVLAYLQQERGEDRVEAAMDNGPCWMTTVNACEVLGKLQELGMAPEEAKAALDDLGLTLLDFDVELACQAAALRARTMSIGASLGDRACLALAERAARAHPTTVLLTAERAWGRLKWPFKILTIR